MCYRNGYGCCSCSQEDNKNKKCEKENYKGMTHQDFQEARRDLNPFFQWRGHL